MEKSNLGAFRPVDRLLCSETGIKLVTLLHFLLGSVHFHTATLQSVPNCVYASHMWVKAVPLIGQSSPVYVPLHQFIKMDDKFAPRAYCGFIAVLANAKRYLYINCSYSQRESRLRPDSILVMRGEEQLITQHFNMKRHSLVPPITNILTKKITVSHKFSLAFTKDTDCCILYNIFPVMNYDTAWFAFFFRIAVCNQAETTSSRRSRYACLVRFWCAPQCDYCIHTCPNEPHQEGQRTLMRFNQTKWGRCESTLRYSATRFHESKHSLPETWKYSCDIA